MKTLDRVFGWLLILGGAGHTAGSFVAYRSKPDLLLWSLGAALFVFLLGAVNLVRAARRGDRSLGWITLVFNLAQFASCLQFGYVIGNMSDPRVIGFSVITLVLAGMSLRTIARGTPAERLPVE
jgi:tellurite resistance protein TehA-like permease